jgi:hypothetical protein
MATKPRTAPRRRERLPVYPEQLPPPVRTEPAPAEPRVWPELPDFANDDVPFPPPESPAESAEREQWMERQYQAQLASDELAAYELDMLIAKWEADNRSLAIVRETLAELRGLRAALNEVDLDPAF